MGGGLVVVVVLRWPFLWIVGLVGLVGVESMLEVGAGNSGVVR